MLQLHRRRRIALDDLQQIALSPDVVAFAIQIFARRLALLLLQLLLLLLDPAELGNRKDADGVEASCATGGDAHPTGRRIDAEVDVLDVLEHHIHRDLRQD